MDTVAVWRDEVGVTKSLADDEKKSPTVLSLAVDLCQSLKISVNQAFAGLATFDLDDVRRLAHFAFWR